ncbi:hypothetical protein VNO77_41997 [Canavalia gladiata]|uniref:Uncharacterized protein n=1 Tax=Canavalia gladiata TaxID=3824 RepID=A0AAN9K0T6_CANGL
MQVKHSKGEATLTATKSSILSLSIFPPPQPFLTLSESLSAIVNAELSLAAALAGDYSPEVLATVPSDFPRVF